MSIINAWHYKKDTVVYIDDYQYYLDILYSRLYSIYRKE